MGFVKIIIFPISPPELVYAEYVEVKGNEAKAYSILLIVHPIDLLSAVATFSPFANAFKASFK